MNDKEWLWNNYLAPGAIMLIAGHPKVGKTTLIEGLTRAMAGGADFLGQTTIPTTALIVSEELEMSFKGRKADLGPAPPRTIIDRSNGSINRRREPWPDFVQRMADLAIENDHGLIVFDSFPRASGLDREEVANDAGAVDEKLTPLLDYVSGELNLAVVLVHHLNRAGYPRGSSAFEGGVDVVSILRRTSTSTRFTIDSKSRYSCTPRSLRAVLGDAPDLDRASKPWTYTLIGEGRQGNRTALWDALEQANGDGATYAELGAMSGAAPSTMHRAIPEWEQAGKVERLRSGTKTDPYRFKLKPTQDSLSLTPSPK